MPNITNAIIGVDIGGSKIAVVLGTEGGEILTRREVPNTMTQSKTESMELTRKAIQPLQQFAVQKGYSITALSISVGGPVRVLEGQLLQPPHLPNWHNTNLKELFSSLVDVPVYVEHDGNAGALAEHQFGAGRGYRNVIFLTAGTGLGGGLVLNNSIYRGSNDIAGEVGHIRLHTTGPESYGKTGSFEAFASASGIVKLAHQRFPGKWSSSMTPRDFFGYVESGDGNAVSVVKESGEWFGKGLAMLIDTLDPDVVIVGSLGRVLGDLWLLEAERVIEEECLPRSKQCVLLPAVLGDQLGDVASLMAAITQKKKAL